MILYCYGKGTDKPWPGTLGFFLLAITKAEWFMLHAGTETAGGRG